MNTGNHMPPLQSLTHEADRQTSQPLITSGTTGSATGQRGSSSHRDNQTPNKVNPKEDKTRGRQYCEDIENNNTQEDTSPKDACCCHEQYNPLVN